MALQAQVSRDMDAVLTKVTAAVKDRKDALLTEINSQRKEKGDALDAQLQALEGTVKEQRRFRERAAKVMEEGDLDLIEFNYEVTRRRAAGDALFAEAPGNVESVNHPPLNRSLIPTSDEVLVSVEVTSIASNARRD